MKAGVDHDPLGTEQDGGVDVGSEVGVDGVGHQRSVFGDVDGRQGVQAEADVVMVAGPANGVGSRLVEAGHEVGTGVELDVDDADVVGGGPGYGVFEREFAADVDADAGWGNGGHGWSLDVLTGGSLRRMWGRGQIPIARKERLRVAMAGRLTGNLRSVDHPVMALLRLGRARAMTGCRLAIANCRLN